MSQEIEKRVICNRVELRAASSKDSIGTLHGYASVFNTLSRDLGGFREVIAPGAFDQVLATDPDVRFLVNHDPNNVLGRTKSGTLKLYTDSIGLCFDVKLPDTTLGRDTRALCMRGDMDECSFAFKCGDGDDSYSKNGSDVTRTIRNFSGLYDASIVTYPAYPGTSASARSLKIDYIVAPPDFEEQDREILAAVYGEAPTSGYDVYQRAMDFGKRIAGEERQSELEAYRNRPLDTPYHWQKEK